MVNTKVTLCGVELDNPVIPASGTFGYGYEFAELYDINLLGTFSFKGTTREPRYGNPTPRIAEYAGGLLNAVGLQNPGVDTVISRRITPSSKHRICWMCSKADRTGWMTSMSSYSAIWSRKSWSWTMKHCASAFSMDWRSQKK